ncbi:23S rRNA (uracil(1939)-C(5))-methyltransferase RlmD [Ethanoligenens harbinense]|uniref:RNA methyltransferase, TrmA family n=1 Tax=Ethanoligenens harbinense (strain DSM 18485 / JCM 12961 / CGMCC 1.5033 / YUAN-3) TaxID=663278 RepID=E6U837_ETHHY|nr:23S rRNA (uracil(1939)-C(5))-methyltransferase RlmD [Ethanoligenens harbinense]ADU27056.1 RNA methyltransferase, TrmA family [Ethanoligenens harbinense YUAN-3]AVQ96136.1 23S rRNA (uracil(1939)-C(5))-methyltransferase RlmD [Ethanoligenens harbinense YUAN-3]AYF38796.1 23S rRNA (uracil(1939)-C(5))-methyltransferase RlmD [Ethanoligenens harbinense]AYF41546.1 23S rRNA (uracil(1939)-C(5))-methyltransferase RlmD [Ethanoligenens harbinense]QCN92377.1 23S rRNA (uracil(1939)-C(5))-methyltransferase R
MALKKNTEWTLPITGVTQDGQGVGRVDDMVVFTPGCARGDTVRVQIVAVRARYAFGRLLAVEQPSPERIPVDCPVFSRCGGCVFRHICYEEELRLKEERVRDALHRIAKLEIEPEPIVGCEQTLAYRNKAQYPVGWRDGRPVFGFYAPRSHRIVSAEECLLQPSVFKNVLGAFERWMLENDVSTYDEQTGKGVLRHVFLRQAPSTGELMICAVVNGGAGRLPNREQLIRYCLDAAPQTKSIVLNRNTAHTNVILGDTCETLWGADRITDVLCGLRFSLSPLSFYQVNSRQAERLYHAAAEFADLRKTDVLLDLYCGVGTIGLSMAGAVGRLIGVEVVPDAVADAKRNAAGNGIENADFFCADAGEATVRLQQQGLAPDVVVVDPPRKGLDAAAVTAVVQMAPSRVVYISCNPETLARDLTLFAEEGYVCTRLRPYDLFPRTAHVECCALLVKR